MKLFEIIVDEIKVFVDSEKLQPGEKLPTESELLKILDVSRTSLREALMVLQNENYLKIIQGKGIFLNKKHSDSINFGINGLEEKEQLNYLHESRAIIEGQLAKLSAERATEEDILLMKRSLENIENKSSSVEDIIQNDYAFHYSVASGSKNPVLKEILKQINEQLYGGRRVTLHFPKGGEKAVRAHKEIFNAIVQGDPTKAESAMKKHIEEIYKPQMYIQALKQEEHNDT